MTAAAGDHSGRSDGHTADLLAGDAVYRIARLEQQPHARLGQVFLSIDAFMAQALQR